MAIELPLPTHDNPGSASTRTWWVALAAALVAAKLAWLSADRAPMLFLGDSESYLTTAVHGWIPPDRSFVYGFLLRALALWPGSAVPLIVAQAAASVAAALMLAWLLRRAFVVPAALAFAICVLWAAAEPLALIYERYLMTEAFALPAFAAFTLFAVRYTDGRRLPDLVLAHAAGTAVIAMRTMFVPVALAFVLLLPLAAWLVRRGEARADRRRSLAVALAVSVAAAFVLHGAYRTLHHAVGGSRGYSGADGFFLLAAWAPALAADDFPELALGKRVLAASACAQASRFDREAQRWLPDCIVGTLVREVGDVEQANRVARKTALRTLRRAPLAVAALAGATWLDGLDAKRVQAAAAWDRGARPLEPATVALLRERLGVAQPERLPTLATPTRRWHEAALPWLMALALTPLVALTAVLVVAPSQRRRLAVVALLATCMAGAAALGATGTVPRYLHPTAWLVMIPLAVLAARAAERRQRPGTSGVAAAR